MRAVSVQTWGSGALERRHSTALEPLAQRSDALGGAHEAAFVVIVPTNHIVSEPASQGKNCSSGADAVCSQSADLGQWRT